jgi:hypothetical protein
MTQDCIFDVKSHCGAQGAMGRRIEDRKSQETCQSYVPHEPSREGGSRMSSLMSVKPQSLMKVGAFSFTNHSKEGCTNETTI